MCFSHTWPKFTCIKPQHYQTTTNNPCYDKSNKINSTKSSHNNWLIPLFFTLAIHTCISIASACQKRTHIDQHKHICSQWSICIKVHKLILSSCIKNCNTHSYHVNQAHKNTKAWICQESKSQLSWIILRG